MGDAFFNIEDIFGSAMGMYNCASCRLFLDCNTPKMDVSGRGDKKILIIGDFPTKSDDMEGVQFKGNSGSLLRTVIKSMGMKLSTDFWKVNAIQCYPGNRKIGSKEIKACRSRLNDIIKKLKPRLIIPLGRTAFDVLIGDRVQGRLKIGKYSDWIGEIIPDQELQIRIAPNYSPVFLLENIDNPFFLQEFKRHFKRAVKMFEAFIYASNYKSDVYTTLDKKQAIEWLYNEVGEFTAFDFETSGRKAQRDGQHIATAGFSNGLHAFAFPWFEDDDFITAWNSVMCGPSRLIAHNAQFESIWSRAKTGRWPNKWHWCTMTGAHSIHNKKPTGLKFCAYAHHGIISYDENVHNYITKSIEPEIYGANAFNKVDEACKDPKLLQELLLYNGMDAHITYKEWEHQERVLSEDLKRGVRFFIKSGDTFAKMHYNGVHMDTRLMRRESKRLTNRLNTLSNEIMDMEEVKRFPGTFNPQSDTQLKKLLYTVLKYSKPIEKPTDKAALEKIDTSFTKAIVQHRKLQKMNGTYIGQFSREVTGDVVHPYFNLAGGSVHEDKGKTVSYRSSSANPNFQNMPKRDPEQMKTIRSLLIPRPGRRIIEYDNKGNEVKAAACITGDKALKAHEEDDTLDMHRDVAALLFMLDIEEVDKKKHRGIVKGDFVFAEFYGSSYKRCAPNLWEVMDDNTKTHVHKKGITTPDKWLMHVRRAEEYLWTRFSGYAQWKKKIMKFYEENGYVDLVTGFRCWGPMSFMEATNYPIQGPAFHIMLWTLNKVNLLLRRKRMKTLCIGQIHDSKVFDVPPDEEEELDQIVYRVGTQDVCRAWDWIDIAPVIEKERSKVDGSWADMEDCGYLTGY